MTTVLVGITIRVSLPIHAPETDPAAQLGFQRKGGIFEYDSKRTISIQLPDQLRYAAARDRAP